MKSWVDGCEQSDFSIYNLPFGIFSTEGSKKKVGIALGDYVIDLSKVAEAGLIEEKQNVFTRAVLNPFIEEGKTYTKSIREKIQTLYSDNSFSDNTSLKEALIPLKKVQMHMPVEVKNYTDFYSSKEHATNVGSMFRDPENALLENWKHLPVGYHGRASSIIVSGKNIHRPKGQLKPADGPPVFGPSKLLDFELEMAFITFKGKPLGQSISTAEADDYIFGFCLFNDWSARDIQKWEYVPLGPFLGKSFASSISPWIVTIEALEPFRMKGETQEPEVLDYLKYTGLKNIDITLEVFLDNTNCNSKIASSNYKYMYWNYAQQLAHHTCNGCNIMAGDMMASGTISGPNRENYGSMLELSWKGTNPVVLEDGDQRKFLQDGDTLSMKGYAEKDGVRVGFGEVKTKVLPAL